MKVGVMVMVEEDVSVHFEEGAELLIVDVRVEQSTEMEKEVRVKVTEEEKEEVMLEVSWRHPSVS